MTGSRIYIVGAVPFGFRDDFPVTLAAGGGRTTTPHPGWGVGDVSRAVS